MFGRYPNVLVFHIEWQLGVKRDSFTGQLCARASSSTLDCSDFLMPAFDPKRAFSGEHLTQSILKWLGQRHGEREAGLRNRGAGFERAVMRFGDFRRYEQP